jgi:predicted dehydrogenase
MSISKRTRVALVGCGIISHQHLQAFGNSRERAELIACCDTSRERAEGAVEKAKSLMQAGDTIHAVTDYEALLVDPSLEAVDLCLPHHLHRPLTIAALRAGKHVLCEKPLALTPEDCDAMEAEAKAQNRILMHGENMRTALNIETAAQSIREGKLGTIVGLQATYAHWQSEVLNKDWRTRPHESGGGHLMDGAIHFVDVLRHLGGEVVGVHAMTTRFRPELGAESEDTGILNFRFEAGHFGQMFACHASRGRGASPLLTVFGTEGCLSIEVPNVGSVVLYPRDREPEVLLPSHGWQTSFDREIAHFLEVIQEGVPLRSTPRDGRENVRVVLAAYESAKTGREVSLSK